jgi:hypothetical protein
MAQRDFRRLSDEQLFADWSRWIERAYDEAKRQAWRHRVFRMIRGIYEQNDQLRDDGGFFLMWAANNYVAASGMALRRELDSQHGVENLYHLLKEMHSRPSVISRRRFKSTWGVMETSNDHLKADRAFDRLAIVRDQGDPNADHIDPASVAEDLAKLNELDDLLAYIQTTLAHRVPERPNASIPTFGDFHNATKAVQERIGFYYAVIKHVSIGEFEPMPQFNVFKAFESPWIPDRSNFNYTACE